MRATRHQPEAPAKNRGCSSTVGGSRQHADRRFSFRFCLHCRLRGDLRWAVSAEIRKPMPKANLEGFDQDIRAASVVGERKLDWGNPAQPLGMTRDEFTQMLEARTDAELLGPCLRDDILPF